LLSPQADTFEDSYVVTYYLRGKIRFENVTDTEYLYYVDPQTHRGLLGRPAFSDAIKRGYFTAIVLDFAATNATDQLVLQDITRYRTYRQVDVIPWSDHYGVGADRIWVRRSPQRPEPRSAHRG
jgi:hypothetical protein